MLPVHDVGVDDGGQGQGADHDAQTGHTFGHTNTGDHPDKVILIIIVMLSPV